MSEPTTTETSPEAIAPDAAAPATTTPDAASAPQAAPHDETDHEPADAPQGREAARYRRQLREAEAERDTLRGQLDAMRRSMVDGMVTSAHMKPTALWASGAQLGDLLDDAGVVDAAKVAAAITTARDALGIPPTPRAPSASGQGNVGSPVGAPSAPGFADAFAPRGAR